MHIRLILLFPFLFLVAGDFQNAPPLLPPHEDEATSEVEIEKSPGDWFVRQRIAVSGVPPGVLERASTAADLLEARGRRMQKQNAASWIFAGPANIGGRVLDIAVDPELRNTLYIAAASGGVWVSRDASNTFTSIWPNANPQAIGALAITPEGVLFAGTGEAAPAGGSLTYGGSGIYRSTNRGKSWQAVGLSASSTIGRIAVDPANSNRIFAAVAGSHYTPGGERGVYLSEDGGLNWRLILKPTNATTGALDLAIDVKNSERIFATMWDRRRHPDRRVYGGVGSGVYFSSNGGTTWKRVGNGLPRASPNIGRIAISFAPSDTKRMFAMVIATNGTMFGFYRSNNGGATWSKAPDHAFVTRSQATYGWWFGRMFVDPRNPDHIFTPGVNLLESSNGGVTWKVLQDAAIDQHAMEWDPHQPGRIYIGNDSGVYRSDNNGEDWVRSSRQPYTQFYSIDVAETIPTRIVGGTQDNGSVRSYPTPWDRMFGSDGQQNLINYRDPKILYVCIPFGSCWYFLDGGERFEARMEGMTPTRRNWFTPVQFDPNDPSIMYYGGNNLDRSTDGGRTWRAISGDLTGGPGKDAYPYGTITTVAAAKTDGNIIYIGTDDGRIWFTRNLGSTWTRAVDPDIPGHWVTRVAVDANNADHAYATFSGYRSGANSAYVLRTTDGGGSWSSITGNLPLAPVNDIIVTPSTLFVGSDVGVFTSRNRGQTWEVAGGALPRAPVTDLRFHEPTKTLFAATFGRGVYKLKTGN